MSEQPLMPPCSLRPIAYRVAPLPVSSRGRRRKSAAWSELALIIETVATDGLVGAARFGCYLLCRGERVLARGLFCGPAATTGEQEALACLSHSLQLQAPLSLEGLLTLLYQYGYKKRLPVAGFQLPAQLARLAADWAAPAAGSLYEGGFSLILWTRPAPEQRRRGQRRLRNGQLEDGYRPRVLIKVLSNGSVAIAFAGRGQPDLIDRIPEGEATPRHGYVFPGHLLPLERLVYGLSGKRTGSLADACAALAVEGPAEEAAAGDDLAGEARACLARAVAAQRLYLALLAGHRALTCVLPPDQVFSPASYGKATLEAIGITPPLARYQGELAGLGAAACAAYGGWSGVGIRSVPGAPPLPVRLLDVCGMYPVCAHELGLWPLLIAKQLSLQPLEPALIEEWISKQRPDSFRLSAELCVFCRLRPQGDQLPHRIRPGKTWLTTLAPLSCEESLWWPLPDLLHSFFATGVVPRIEACLRLSGQGSLPGLTPVELRGLGRFDPASPGADLFLFLAEGKLQLEQEQPGLEARERRRLSSLYKLWDNSACSGIFLEVHPQEPRRKPRRGSVIGPDGSYQTTARAFEEPGRWFFPPFYSLVTAAARLLLGLAMHEVRQAGGSIAYWDTDSLAIVASPEAALVPCPGGPHRDHDGRPCVRALSYAQVEAIRWRLERHSPYSERVRPRARLPLELPASGDHPGASQMVEIPQPTLFRLEPESFAGAATGSGQTYLYAVASKRKTVYTLGDDGRKHAVSPSEFALGHLSDPTGNGDKSWIAAGWQWAALSGPEPAWLDQPALAHSPLTRHADLQRLRGRRRTGPRPWDTLIIAQADRHYGRHSADVLPRPVTLYRADLDLKSALWQDFATGQPLPGAQTLPRTPHERTRTGHEPLPLHTLRSLLAAHIRAPEQKALSPAHTPCQTRTAGLLTPAATNAYATIPIGRESNYTEDAGLLHDSDYTHFPDPRHQPSHERALTILRAHARQADARNQLAADLALSESAIRRYLKTGKTRRRTRERALNLAAALASDALTRAFPDAKLPQDPAALLYLAPRAQRVFEAPACEGCGAELTGRQKRWCARCRARPRVRGRSA